MAARNVPGVPGVPGTRSASLGHSKWQLEPAYCRATKSMHVTVYKNEMLANAANATNVTQIPEPEAYEAHRF